jgi:hypothetical protein
MRFTLFFDLWTLFRGGMKPTGNVGEKTRDEKVHDDDPLKNRASGNSWAKFF